MSGFLSRLAGRFHGPAVNTPSIRETGGQAESRHAEQAAALQLARELLHAVEQFVVPAPDLNTERFLERMRRTAAGLTPTADIPTLRLYQEWVKNALGSFGALQRQYVADRESEMWRLLSTCAECVELGVSSDRDLVRQLREHHERLRDLASLEDARAAREHLAVELQRTRALVEEKAREDRARMNALARQVSALQQTLSSVRGQARYDALTGLFHGAALQQRLEQALAESIPCSLAVMDLDDLKTINDTLGHAVGDRLLCALADQLRRVSRSTDVPARFGGDEFCFLALGCRADQLAQRLAGALARRHIRVDVEERACSALLSVSAGIADSVPGDTPSALLQRADAAMLAGKRLGKGTVRLATGP